MWMFPRVNFILVNEKIACLLKLIYNWNYLHHENFCNISIYKLLNYFFFQVKINGQNQDMLRAAAEQFGGKEESEIAKGKKLENLITVGPWLLRIFRPLDWVWDINIMKKLKVAYSQTVFHFGSSLQKKCAKSLSWALSTNRKNAQDSDLALFSKDLSDREKVRLSHF